MFSFALWPFSMKLLWAPLVDSLYVRKLGRRKSWLIPIQYTLGINEIQITYTQTQLSNCLFNSLRF